MDNLMEAGKEFLAGQSQQQGDNQGSNQQHRGNYPAGGGFTGDDDDEDFRRAHQEASRHAGDSGDSGMFSNILSAIGQKKGSLQNEDIDEQDVVRKHQNAYDDNHEANTSELGTGAALQALKLFNQGGSSGQSKGDFMGLAMSEASKLFDSKAAMGMVSGGSDKESVVQKAGEMALKMYVKSQMSGGGGGAGNLLGLASKFM